MSAKAIAIAVLLAAVVVVPAISYMLPTTTAVKVVSTENKKGSSSDQLRVRTLAISDDGGVNVENTLVYRNEDATFFPPYFKWDSEDLQTKFDVWSVKDSDFSNSPTVYVKSYGWRIKWLSMFPNATSARIEK